MPAACQVFGQLVFGVLTGFDEVFFPFNDDVAVCNIGKPGFGRATARYVENRLFTALGQLVHDIARRRAVLEQATQEVLKPEFFGLFAVGLAQATQVVGNLFLNFVYGHL